MKQVNYEEAKKALRRLSSIAYMNLEDDLLLDEYIHQNTKRQTLTLDEVVNTALKNNFDCWYEEDLNRIVFGAALPEYFVYKDKVVSAIPQTNHYFKYYEMFDMGRRYLESQKENGDE